MKLLLVLVSVLCTGISVSGVSYDGYKVYSVSPNSSFQADALKALENELNLDFWERLSRVEFDRTYRIMVASEHIAKFESELVSDGITHSILIDNVDQMVSNEKSRNLQARRLGRIVDGIDFDHYWQFDEIEAYLARIAVDYPNLVTLETLGQTHDENDIIAVKISKATGGVDGTRPVAIVEGTIHAREWITTMICMHLISELVENSAENDDLLDGLDWVIVPVLNVDGYKFTYAEGGDRFWRKNRSPNEGYATCPGTDLNRNFKYKWEVQASTSPTPCGITWAGSEPESEIEVKIISELMLRYNKTVLFLDVHSYGSYFLYAWSYDYILLDNFLVHDEVGARFRQAVYNVAKTKYSMGNSAFTLYQCSGVTVDFAIGVAKIPLAWTLELPGDSNGNAGFDLPPQRIKPVIDETFPALRELALFVQERYVKN